MKTVHRREISSLSALCCIAYFATYTTRVSYAAVISEVIRDLTITKELASLAVTSSFFAYGAGQVISGWVGDHVPPKYMITAGLCGTGFCNFLVSLQDDPLVIALIWGCNGFFQSMIWPPLVRVIAETMIGDDYLRTTANVLTVATMGTVFVYLTAPLMIALGGWRLVLRVPSGIALTVAICWQKIVKAGRKAKARPIIEKASPEETEERIPTWKVFMISGLPLICLGGMMYGSLKDGVTTWMPSYISENFSLGTGIAILSTTILPIFSALCIQFSAKVYVWCGHNEMKAASLFFVAASIAAGALYVFFDNFILSVCLMAIICGCCYGNTQLLASNCPGRFMRYGCVSTVSGLINAFVYMASALAAYIFAVVAERWDWRTLVLMWLLCAVIGYLGCVLNGKRWKKFIA